MSFMTRLNVRGDGFQGVMEPRKARARARACVCVRGDGLGGRGGGENRKPKGWAEVVGYMMKHSSVFTGSVVNST